jgi:hypothetical protein
MSAKSTGTGRGARRHEAQPIGAFGAIATFAGMLLGILFARIVAEFILMVFRITEHLAAGGM